MRFSPPMAAIGGREVGAIGFGMIGLTWRPVPYPVEHSIRVLREALENGSKFGRASLRCFILPIADCKTVSELLERWRVLQDSQNISLTLLERYFERCSEDVDRVFISIKAGMNPTTRKMDGSAANTRRTIDNCMALLKGRKKIVLFQFARVDLCVPMANTFSLIEREYVRTGKIVGVGLSEVSPAVIDEVMKYTRMLAVEVELSM